MNGLLNKLFGKQTTKEHCKDTGMAMVLLLLIFCAVLGRDQLLPVAIVVLVVNMTFPLIFRPVACLWFAFSHLIGTFMSKILLTIVFCVVVTPVGLVRRLLGKDSLNLKGFKVGDRSVLIVRDHVFTGKDLEKPY